MLDKWAPITHPRDVSPVTDLSESVRECATRIIESRAAALAGLYDLTSLRLVRYATTLTRNQHDGEDAVQTALVKVAARPEVLASAQNPWGYLLRMVRNEALQIVRKRKRWSILKDLSDLLIRRRVDELEQEDSRRMIWSALRELPTEQAEVVVLKIWEGFTFAEIAAMLDIPPATSASRYRYAMERLETKLHSLAPESANAH